MREDHFAVLVGRMGRADYAEAPDLLSLRLPSGGQQDCQMRSDLRPVTAGLGVRPLFRRLLVDLVEQMLAGSQNREPRLYVVGFTVYARHLPCPRNRFHSIAGADQIVSGRVRAVPFR
ncbi:hypothetical protein BIU87_03595 [Streptomyces sp. ZS0098]|nr:hypothetical protein BIU87_03595 [Streptomyces sp. ZS0098]